MARTTPGEIRSQLPASAPETPEDFGEVFRDLERLILPGLSHWQHPGFFGYFPANASLASVLGDYLSTGLGVLGLSWQASPALTELEEVVTDWVRQMVGLSDAWSGVIQDTASTSTLVALLCARERATDFGMSRGGLQAEPQPLVVYTSGQAHSSVDKAALLAGFGRDNVEHRGARRGVCHAPESLAEAVRTGPRRAASALRRRGDHRHDDLDRPRSRGGHRPAWRSDHGLWLHVDAAMAGSAMILPECRWMWEGIEGADSLVAQRPQVAGGGLRLLALLRQGPGAPHPGHVHRPELPEVLGGRAGQEPPGLGHPAGTPLPCPEALVPAPCRGGRRLQARLRRDLDNARWLADEVRSAPAGGYWPRCPCKPSASVTSRRAWRGRRWTSTRWAGASESTARAQPT